MTNDTAVSPILGTLLALAMLALVCAPVMAANVTYPQEYSDLGIASYEVAFPTWGYDDYVEINDPKYAGRIAGATRIGVAQWMELRRQTILMEKQNELLEEQNELMGRLVNATEIKFVCTATGYATQATSWSLDDPEASLSFNTSDYEYALEDSDKISCDSMAHFQGCP